MNVHQRPTVALPRPARRVLLVEDDPDQARLLVHWLESSQLHVHVANDGDAGLVLAYHGDFDIVLSDLHMPGANGIEVIRGSKEARPERPAVIMSAYEDLVSVIAALREDADDFFLKPLARTPLMQRLDELLATPEPATRAIRVG